MSNRTLLLFTALLLCRLVTNVIAQNVQPFTGNFSAGQSLMIVPTPDNGSSPEIGALYYNGGIGVNLPASEIGLGWDLMAGGAITRSVSGIPDDWDNKQAPNSGKKVIEAHYGAFNLDGFVSNVTDRTLDVYKTPDTPYFYHPDYDYYQISGPGMSGQLKPYLFDYATINIEKGSGMYKYGEGGSLYKNFTKTAQFVFQGDFADTLVSRHFQSSPYQSSDLFKLPNESVTYNSVSNTTPYTGAKGKNTYDGYNSTDNRLWSTKYVEYTTNSDGIDKFYVTNEAGYKFHYTQPVYVKYQITGNYPLNNDYSLKTYSVTYTNNGSDSIGKETNHDNYVVFSKQSQKYAYQWLLTAITGPDYIDNGTAGITDDDKGYWVKFDYQLWSNNFTERTPKYGMNYSFNGNHKDLKCDDPINTSGKMSGKFGSYSIINKEVYYLNSIKTSTHTAILVRDLRKDEHSDIRLKDEMTGNMPNNYDDYIFNSPVGKLSDNGGLTGNYTGGLDQANTTVTINIPSGSNLIVNFKSFDVGINASDADYLQIKKASGAQAYAFSNYAGSFTVPSLNTDYTITPAGGNYFTIGMYSDGDVQAGFEMDWRISTIKYTPELKISKIALFRNEEFATLPSLSQIQFADAIWDGNNTQASQNKFYNADWYAANTASIESKILNSVEFIHDYTLARKYHNNINTLITGGNQLSNPGEIQNSVGYTSGNYDNSGKLTLREITKYGLAHASKVEPSTQYDYNYTVSTDNPDFDPRKTDYWGYYKSDVTTKALSGYVTSTSKDYTDAWSMRKITLPTGGTIEMDYESDVYDKVLNGIGTGTTTGPSRIYMINDVTDAPSCTAFNFTLEDDVTDFWALANNQTNTAVVSQRQVYIPSADATPWYQIFEGVFDLVSSNNTLIDDISIWQLASPHADGRYYFYRETDPTPDCLGAYPYTGNGYFYYRLPITTNGFYGGGVRVKSITSKTGTDSYKQEYSYSEGVATSEPDRFALPRKIYNVGGDTGTYYMKLRSRGNNKYQMSPMVGYTKVTTRNVGQTTTAQGEQATTFLTSDAGYDNYKANLIVNSANMCTSCGTAKYYVYEITDKFSSLWGQLLETKVTDVNSNVLSITKNEYSVLTQGSIVENFHTRLATYPGAGIQGEHVSILRTYPSVLTSTTTYTKGMSVTTQNLKFDEITGSPIVTRSTEPNKGITEIRTLPAFRVSHYNSNGLFPKSVSSSNSNVLGGAAEIRVMKDTSIIADSDFLSHSIQTFKKELTVRKFNTSNNVYENQSVTGSGSYWTGDKNFGWTGPLDNYGVFNQSSFVAYDHTTSSNDSKWRFGSDAPLLDERGHTVETRGFNNRFAAVKFHPKFRYPIASASNVNYASFTFTSFEDTANAENNADPRFYFDGEVLVNSGVYIASASGVTPHTGNYLVKVPADAIGPIFKSKYTSGMTTCDSLQRGRTYHASVWVHKNSTSSAALVMSLEGNCPSSNCSTSVSMSLSSSDTVMIGDWIQLNVELTVPSNYVSGGYGHNDFRVYVFNPAMSGDAYFDDLIVHPVDAPMSGTVVDRKTGRVLATLDNNNFSTRYVYDAAGRVTEVYQEIHGVGIKKQSKTKYNFSRGL